MVYGSVHAYYALVSITSSYNLCIEVLLSAKYGQNPECTPRIIRRSYESTLVIAL